MSYEKWRKIITSQGKMMKKYEILQAERKNYIIIHTIFSVIKNVIFLFNNNSEIFFMSKNGNVAATSEWQQV